MQARKTYLAAVLGCLALASAAAQASLGVSLHDRRIYQPGSEILVRVTIRNDGAGTYRFKLAEDRRHSVSFELRSLSNRAAAASDSWKRAMASSSPVFYREIALRPGEEYSFVEDLRDYLEVAEPGPYLLHARFWPELFSAAAGGAGAALATSVAAVASPALSISIRPGSPTPAAAQLFRADDLSVLRPERIAPDEVVTRTIRARQRGLWNEFFLYLDLERLLKANPEKRRAYDRESDDGRRRMLESYRAELMASTVDNDIVVVPSSFEIVETRYRPAAGTVVAMLRFAYDGFSLLKQYTYELEKRNDIWYIVSYTVLNKGSE